MFRDLFGTEENKRYALSLYNALAGTGYDDPGELELNTLDDVIFIQNGEVTLHKSTDEIRAEHHESVDALFREVFRW